jgi:hypothetical protein
VIIRALIVLAALAMVAAASGAQSRAGQAKPPSASGTQKPGKVEPIPDQPRRLIMKDGSYQQTIRWEKKADRVRYFSAERYEWEEVPESMVDWAATEKYAKEGGEPRPPVEVQEADAEEAAERKAEEDKSPEIKPGLRLPTQGGVFLLDIYRDQPELIELVQSGGDINKNTGKNVLRAAINPLAKAKQTIEVKGAHAPVQAHVPQPAIYLNIDTDQNPDTGPAAQDVSSHFRIVRMTSKKDARVAGTIEVAVYGKVSQKGNFIATSGEALTPQWIKLTPATPLEPGEYAVVEMLGKDMNLYVWDFGINPSAPENSTAWKPGPVENTATGTRQSPVLNKRPPKE